MSSEHRSGLARAFNFDELTELTIGVNYQGMSAGLAAKGGVEAIVAGPWPKERQIKPGAPRLAFERPAKCLGRTPREIKVTVRTSPAYAEDDLIAMKEAAEWALKQLKAGRRCWAIELNNKLNPPPKLYDGIERRKRKLTRLRSV
jgi:hypothetical protein